VYIFPRCWFEKIRYHHRIPVCSLIYSNIGISMISWVTIVSRVTLLRAGLIRGGGPWGPGPRPPTRNRKMFVYLLPLQ
jgi:hypothetical protein